MQRIGEKDRGALIVPTQGDLEITEASGRKTTSSGDLVQEVPDLPSAPRYGTLTTNLRQNVRVTRCLTGPTDEGPLLPLLLARAPFVATENATRLAPAAVIERMLARVPATAEQRALEALDVLGANLRQVTFDGRTYRMMIPKDGLYPQQWNWDTGLISIGLAHLDPELALEGVELLLDAGQIRSGALEGMVPHMIFWTEVPGALEGEPVVYNPGSEFWGTDQAKMKTSIITQPPTLATALKRILENGGDPERVAALLPKVAAYHRYLLRELDPLQIGAVGMESSWASGMDNSPAYASAMEAIDGDKARPFTPGETPESIEAQGEDGEGHADLATWKKYARIVDVLRDRRSARDLGMLPEAVDDKHPREFMVYDPWTTALAHRDAGVLAKVARRTAELLPERAGELTAVADEADRFRVRFREGLDRLWIEEEGRYGHLDVVRGGFVPAAEGGDVLASYAPVALDDEPTERRTRMRETLQSRFLLARGLATAPPTLADGRVNETYSQKNMWSGPDWIVTDWWFADGLEDVHDRALNLVERGFFEYYDPETGNGKNGRFSWSASLALDLLIQKQV